MSRHRIDLSASFSAALLASRPDEQGVEAILPEVAEADPPKNVVRREVYQPGDELVSAVNLAIALGRPLLLQGDPGCGKTRLAHAVAYALQLPLEECYIKST